MMNGIMLVLGVVVLTLLVKAFVAWIAWLCLGVVLPAFGIATPGYGVVFCGVFLLGIVGSAFRSTVSK